MTVGTRERARMTPTAEALRDDRAVLDWATVDEMVNRAAHALRQLDLDHGRRVAVYAENSVETVLVHIAGLIAGVSTVPINFHLTGAEVEYIVRDSGAVAMFVGPETAKVGCRVATTVGVPLVVGWRCPADSGVVLWTSWWQGGDRTKVSEDIAPRPNLMYTSGTTGFPKGVEMPPSMFAPGRTVAEHLDALATNPFARLHRHLIVGPMYHTGPITGVRLLATGVSLVVHDRFDATAVLAAIEEHRIDSTIMVPTHFVRLLALPSEVRTRYDVSSLVRVAHTGASCPVDIKRRMIEWWGPVLFDAYGATEVGITCAITSQEWLERPGSVGRSIPPFRAIVVDDNGNEVPPSTEGRLFFEDATGRGIVYPGDPPKTAAAHLRPGIFSLGEVGYVDADGYVYITDRFSDMIVSGGVNIYPAEAEQVLLAHPLVDDVAVIGVPDAEMGEAVKALVVPADRSRPPSANELISHCRERLAAYKCPRTVDIVDSVGRTPIGKLNKRVLRAPFWDSAPTITD